ncbi:flavin reductase [Azohydromonas lata]|uniref:Flavin reductase n=1 Tax=Azohydromonas lata TaxID=45677 RepID=A0ABU5IDS1_9BURK|nr:flavin reductase [Azohydromonas lata]MDZ5456810.1 flavin reductase [Azohydromonas lata]
MDEHFHGLRTGSGGHGSRSRRLGLRISSYNYVSTSPPMVAVNMATRDGAIKDTARNIQASGEFVINVATEVKVMSSPKAQETLATLGAVSTVMGPEAFAAHVKTDEKQLVPIIRSLGLTPNN